MVRQPGLQDRPRAATLQFAYHAKAKIEVQLILEPAPAGSGSAVFGAIEPGATLGDDGLRFAGQGALGQAGVIACPWAGGEFPYVARHVMHPPAIGAQLADFHRAAADEAARQQARPLGSRSVVVLARVVERVGRRDAVTLRISARRAGAAGVFPFLLGGQAIALGGLPGEPGAV